MNIIQQQNQLIHEISSHRKTLAKWKNAHSLGGNGGSILVIRDELGSMSAVTVVPERFDQIKKLHVEMYEKLIDEATQDLTDLTEPKEEPVKKNGKK